MNHDDCDDYNDLPLPTSASEFINGVVLSLYAVNELQETWDWDSKTANTTDEIACDQLAALRIASPDILETDGPIAAWIHSTNSCKVDAEWTRGVGWEVVGTRLLVVCPVSDEEGDPLGTAMVSRRVTDEKGAVDVFAGWNDGKNHTADTLTITVPMFASFMEAIASMVDLVDPISAGEIK